MSFIRHQPASLTDSPPARRRGRHVASLLLMLGLTASVLTGVAALPANAATACDPGTDVCVAVPDTVPTPLGPVTIAVSAENVVTVQLMPTVACTQVIGI